LEALDGTQEDLVSLYGHSCLQVSHIRQYPRCFPIGNGFFGDDGKTVLWAGKFKLTWLIIHLDGLYADCRYGETDCLCQLDVVGYYHCFVRSFCAMEEADFCLLSAGSRFLVQKTAYELSR
jgi:hypothetical protein